MAPEALASSVEPASDTWAAGVMAYQVRRRVCVCVCVAARAAGQARGRPQRKRLAAAAFEMRQPSIVHAVLTSPNPYKRSCSLVASPLTIGATPRRLRSRSCGAAS